MENVFVGQTGGPSPPVPYCRVRGAGPPAPSDELETSQIRNERSVVGWIFVWFTYLAADAAVAKILIQFTHTVANSKNLCQYLLDLKR